MYKAKIYGAGSIGAHYAHALVNNNFEVDIYDISKLALESFKKKLYPGRYKRFSKNIHLLLKDNMKKNYELVIVGTPPKTHFNIVLKNLINKKCKIIHVEKPLCSSFDKDIQKFSKFKNVKKPFISVGYNHVLTRVCQKSIDLIRKNLFGKLLYIESETKEHWDNIFNAHFWLNKVSDSYLGNSVNGGGALHEHSHALHLAHYFLKQVDNNDDFKKVFCKMQFNTGNNFYYDSLSKLEIITKKDVSVSIHQDLVSKKSSKRLHLEFKNGYLTLFINYKPNVDLIKYKLNNKKENQIKFKKKRSDDFLGTVNNYKRYLAKTKFNGDLNLIDSLKIMKTIQASFLSNKKRKLISIK